MKKSFLFVIALLSFCCASNNTYYEKPVKNWLERNLNDISSYEPVEFTIVNSDNLSELNQTISIRYASFGIVVERKMNIISSVISLITDPTVKSNLIQNQKLILEGIKSEIDFLPKYFELDNEVNKILINIDNVSIDQAAMLDGTNNRIMSEKDLLESELNKIGTSINQFANEIKNGQFIFHKFRAKNSFGAFVLSSFIFKLDINKTFVESEFEIE